MKTKDKTFDSVKFMRERREELSKTLSKMSKKEVKEYLKNRKVKGDVKPST